MEWTFLMRLRGPWRWFAGSISEALYRNSNISFAVYGTKLSIRRRLTDSLTMYWSPRGHSRTSAICSSLCMETLIPAVIQHFIPQPMIWTSFWIIQCHTPCARPLNIILWSRTWNSTSQPPMRQEIPLSHPTCLCPDHLHQTGHCISPRPHNKLRICPFQL